MAKSKSDRSSVAVALEQAKQAQLAPPEWPCTQEHSGDEIKDAEIIHIFNQVISTRAPDAWTPVDVIRAATLAQLLFLTGRDVKMLISTGTLIKGARGLKPSPVLYSLEKLNAQANSLCRALGLTMQSNGLGDVRDQKALNNQFAAEHGGPQPVFSLLAGGN